MQFEKILIFTPFDTTHKPLHGLTPEMTSTSLKTFELTPIKMQLKKSGV